MPGRGTAAQWHIQLLRKIVMGASGTLSSGSQQITENLPGQLLATRYCPGE